MGDPRQKYSCYRGAPIMARSLAIHAAHFENGIIFGAPERGTGNLSAIAIFVSFLESDRTCVVR